MCKYWEVRIERPTAGSCKRTTYCKKYKEECIKQCDEESRTVDKSMNRKGGEVTPK